MIKKLLFSVLLICLFHGFSKAQCNVFTTTIASTQNAPTVIGQTITANPGTADAGRRNFVVTNMVSGATYRVSTCTAPGDTQLGIYEFLAPYTNIAYNDDDYTYCGTNRSTIDFQPPSTGSYRMQSNRYNCQVTGTLDNGPITVTLLSNPPTSHCVPPVTTDNRTRITNFSTTGGTPNITNNGSGWSANGYGNNYATMSVGQYASASVNFSLTLATGASNTAGIAIWVDWNNNFVFDPSEQVSNSGGYVGNGTYTGVITVPAATIIGDYRMRVKVDYNRPYPDPCANGGGRVETEDYKFTVIPPPAPTITTFPASACAASSIIINGTNLNGATAVTIGGTAAAITANNNTTVTVTVGSGTTGVVSVTTPNGTATTVSPNIITVNALPDTPPAPTSDSPVCSPASVTITATGAAPVGENWYWQTTATGTSTANDAVTPLTITTVGTFTRYIRSYNGTCWSDAASIDITVNQSASIQTQPIAPAAICAGQGTVTLTVAATGVTSYQWRRGTTLLTNVGVYSGADTATLTITNPAVGNAGNYTVVLNGPDCPLISDVAVVTVNAAPSNPGNPTSVNTACSPNSITVSAPITPTSPPIGVTWYWQTTAGGTSTANDAVTPMVITAVGTTTVYVRAFNGTCWSPGAGSRTVTINQSATIVTQPVTPAQLCTGQGTVTISVTATGVTSYQWQRNGTNLTNGAIVAGATTQTLTLTNPTVANAGSYTVILNRLTCPLTSDAVDVIINALPINPGTPTSDSPQCNPTGVTLTRLAAPPVNEQYYWQTTVGGTSTINGGATYNVNATATYYIRAYNTLTGCWSSGSGSRAVVVNNPISTLATNPVPANNTTGVCYVGTGTLTTINWTAAAGAVNYDVYFGTTATPSFLITRTQLNAATGALAANTTYYWKIVPKNTCGETIGSVETWSFTTNSLPCYCTPSVSNGYQDDTYLDKVSFVGTLNDVTNNSTYSNNPRGYEDFTGLSNRSSQAQGEGINVFARIANFGAFMKAWVDWNRDGNFSTAELVYTTNTISLASTTFGISVPATQAVGLYRLRIRVSEPGFLGFGSNYDACENLNYYGETEDYLFEVVPSCGALITNITNGETCGLPLGGNVTVPLLVDVSAGSTEVRWYTALTGGSLIQNTGISGTSSSWSPSIGTTTTYYVTAYNGICESLVRTAIVAKVKPVANITYSPTAPESCGEDSIVTLTASGDNEVVTLIDEDFEAVNLTGLGVFSLQPLGTNNANANWRRRQSTYIPVPPAQQVWFPAISSGFGPNKFAMATSDLNLGSFDNALLSPVAPTTAFFNLTLTFKMYYSDYSTSVAADNVSIEVATNPAGDNWTNVYTYNTSVGIGTIFSLQTLDLSAYVNQPNFRFRIRYSSGWADGVAIDDIKLYGERPLAPSFSWFGIPAVAAYLDLAATIPYVTGSPASTVYIKPTLAQLELGTFSFSATATLTNGCTTSQPITITNKSRVWKGTNGNDWDDPSNWLPNGVPTADNCVIIPTGTSVKIPNNSIPIPPIGFLGLAKNLTIKNGSSLELLSGNNLTVSDWIHNEGTNNFDIRNDASLLQVNDAVNIGAMKMDRTLMVKKTDYTYYSSPVDNNNILSLSPGTPSGVKLKWEPTTNPGGGFEYGNWISPGSEIMAPGKGYIVRGPSAFVTEQSLTAVFDGTPRNGNITVPITRGDYQVAGIAYDAGRPVTKDDDNYNLIGNPYPSAIDASAFLNNTQNNNILGTIWLWPHGGILSAANPDPFYENYVYNYNSNDYITWNAVGSVPSATFSGYIAAGQSFFVLMSDTGNPSENLYFNNTMRVTNNNTEFLRSSEVVQENEMDIDVPEPQRIYLDLVKPDGKTNSILVGYTEDATYESDRLFDSPVLDNATQLIYSKIGEENMIIQGRPMPLDQNDQVPLGVLIPQQGIYTIAINSVNGIFLDATQDIYLEDYVTGMIHNLKNAPYIFNAEAGRYDNRFMLRYNDDNTLNTPEITTDSDVKITGLKEYIKVTAGNSPIKTITVFDAAGRMILDYKDVKTMEFKIPLDKVSEGTLVVKVTLENGKQKTKKVVH